MHTIQIANYEFFSSTFKDFEVYGNDKFSEHEWKLIGKFEANSSRTLQTFKLDQPYWYRYVISDLNYFSSMSDHFSCRFLKIVIISHHGSEFFCPISEVRVQGVHILQRLKEQIESDQIEVGKVEQELLQSKQEPSPMKLEAQKHTISSGKHLSKKEGETKSHASEQCPPVISPASIPFLDYSEFSNLFGEDIVDESLDPAYVINTSHLDAHVESPTTASQPPVHPTAPSTPLTNFPHQSQSSNTNLAGIVQQLSAKSILLCFLIINTVLMCLLSVKSLQINMTITAAYIDEMNSKYKLLLNEIHDIVAATNIKFDSALSALRAEEEMRFSEKVLNLLSF